MSEDGIRFETMSVGEIAELLQISEEEAAAVRDFIVNVGGVEQAYNAIELLEHIAKAA